MAELATLAVLALTLAGTGFAAHRLRLPPALGYLAGGIAVAAARPELIPAAMEHAAEVGVLALLFLIGLELDVKRLRQTLRATAWTLPFDVVLPGVAVAGAARLLGWPFTQALALGICMAVSSTVFGDRLAANATPAARQRVLGTLISEDVAAGALIIALVVLATGAGGLEGPALAVGRTAFLLLFLAAGALLTVPRILDEVARRHTPELHVLWTIALVLLFGYLGHLAGSAELGALLAGVAAAEAGSRYVTRNAMGPLRDVAYAIFFFVAGAAVDLHLVGRHLGLALMVAAAFLVAKHLVHVPAATSAGVSLLGGLQTAAALATVGEFSLILVAVAEREGIAHPGLRAVVTGAMLVLLPLATGLAHATPALERAFWRLPPALRDPVETLGRALRRPTRPAGDAHWQAPARRLLTNALLLTAVTLVAVALRPLVPALPEAPAWTAGAMWFGALLTASLPGLRGAYRGYRDLVWVMVGLRPGERVGAGKVRVLLVDAWTLLTTVLVLALISLWVPRALPVLVGGALLAAVVAGFAWRRLNRFHRSMESALGRVLGDDETSAGFLDQVLDRYPWGVRFAAVSVPPGSSVIGRSLADSRIASLTGATVAVIQRGRQEQVNPPPEEVLRAGDHLVLLGDAQQLARAEALLVAHGEAVRMSAKSLAAEVRELVITPGSPWDGRSLVDLGLRRLTGTLIVGVWDPARDRAAPFQPDRVLREGDRLVLLGTPLQLQRAEVLAQGIREARPEA